MKTHLQIQAYELLIEQQDKLIQQQEKQIQEWKQEVDREGAKYLPAVRMLEDHIFKTQGYKTLYEMARKIDIEYAKDNGKGFGVAESAEIDYEGKQCTTTSCTIYCLPHLVSQKSLSYQNGLAFLLFIPKTLAVLLT